MSKITSTADIPVIYQDQDDEPRPTTSYVWVSRCMSQHEHGGAGHGVQTYCVAVYAHVGQETPHAGEVWRTTVRGGSRWEPETINTLGGQGAYRDLPPNNADVEKVIDEAKRHIRLYLARMPRLARDTRARRVTDRIDANGQSHGRATEDATIPTGTPYHLFTGTERDSETGEDYFTIATPGYVTYHVNPRDLKP